MEPSVRLLLLLIESLRQRLPGHGRTAPQNGKQSATTSAPGSAGVQLANTAKPGSPFLGFPLALAIDGLMLRLVDKPGTAAVLSFFVPGVGQIYNGEFWRGIFWLIITPGFWLGTGGMGGWVCHLIASYTAYKRAQLKARSPQF